MVVTVTEQQLRASGALRDACDERVARICLMCGTTATDAAEWQRSGGKCGVCDNDTYRDECTRCRGECPATSGSGRHPCVSVAVFRSTGRIAFPEKMKEETQRESERKSPPKPVPPLPPVIAAIGGAIAGIWRRWLRGFSHFADFGGRSGVKDFWAFMIVQVVFAAIGGAVGAAPAFLVITAVPTLSIATRRLHDVGLSGHWMWLVLGASWQWPLVVLLIMLVWPGAKGRNAHGDPPAG